MVPKSIVNMKEIPSEATMYLIYFNPFLYSNIMQFYNKIKYKANYQELISNKF